MEDISLVCPSEEMIYQYFRRELDEDQLLTLNQHFAFCDKCIAQHNYYEDYINTRALTSTVIKEIWKESNIDTFEYAAADSNEKNAIELTSQNGKYTVKLLPSDDLNESLLIINVLDSSSKGKLIVNYVNDENVILIGDAEIKGSEICFIVSSDINLKKLIISIE